MPREYPITFRRGFVLTLLLTLITACTPYSLDPANQSHTIISVVGTNDVHGQLTEAPYRGGLAALSGYVNVLRAKRASDNGGVVLIDAGDMWQGTLESNLSEGATMIEAFNALGYNAVAVGNHEFDFGPVGERSTPADRSQDPRGALKARATEANFPLLAANLIDKATNKPVAWPNVKPAVLLEVADIKVGIIGVMTFDALEATIAANVGGLRVAPLAETIEHEARKLRESGASLIIVTAHAGGSCDDFDDPNNLDTCDLEDEIFGVANALPNGLIDQIIAGHHHRGIAHFVNDIAITASFSSTRGFGRVDYTFDSATKKISDINIHPPRRPCALITTDSGECIWDANGEIKTVAATYEGKTITPDPVVAEIVERAKQDAKELKSQPLGVFLETPFTLANRPESSLGNLMTDALLQTSSADISMHNIYGGIRSNVTEGELTFGKIYQMFPFDNRVVELRISGAELRRVIAAQAHRKEKRAGFSGMRVYVQCNNNNMSVKMLRTNGAVIHDDDSLVLAINDFLVLGGDDVLGPIIPDGGYSFPSDTPLARNAIIDWLKNGPSRLNASQFLGPENRRWHMPDTIPADCALYQ